MKFMALVVIAAFACALAGCETAHKAGEATGKVVGSTMEAVGSISEGGAEVYHGGETAEENPYGR